jgi:hypothetical protein
VNFVANFVVNFVVNFVANFVVNLVMNLVANLVENLVVNGDRPPARLRSSPSPASAIPSTTTDQTGWI